MGLRPFGRIQSGLETTAGSAVAATVRWSGVNRAEWHEERMVDQPEELRASIARFFRGDTLSKMATIAADMECTFEMFPFAMSLAVKAGTAGVSDGSGTPAYLYTADPTLTTTDDPAPMTLEVGDETQGYEAEYCFARSLEISAAIQERTQMRLDLVGRQLTTTTFTSLANGTPEAALGQNWKIYVDDTGGTIGTTQFPGCITGFTWRLPEAYMPHHCLDGNLYFNRHEQAPMAPELEFTVEVDAAAGSVRTDWTNGTRQLIRLENTGSEIHPGTPAATANKYIRIDGAYRILDWGPVGGADNQGVQTVRVTARGEYDPTWAKLLVLTCNNAKANLATP